MLSDLVKNLKNFDFYTFADYSPLGFVPSGVLSIDYVLGTPGFPLGRIVEIYGYESVGKSAIVAAVMGAAHQLGGVSFLADTEHAYSPEWVDMFLVDREKVAVFNPAHVQQAVEVFANICDLCRSKDLPHPRVLAWDSIAATPVFEEVDAESDKSLGLHARALSKALRRLTNKLEEARALFICTNQQKEKISTFGPAGATKIGGHAMDFHAAVQLQLKKVALIPDKENGVIGMRIQIVAVKNKISRPYLSSTVDYYFDRGFDDSSFVIHFAKKVGLLEEKGGGWRVYKGQKFQGVPEGDILSEIEKDVISIFYGELAPKVLQIRQLRRKVKFDPFQKWRINQTNEDQGENNSDVDSDMNGGNVENDHGLEGLE